MSYARNYASIPFLSNARATIALEQISERALDKGDEVVEAEAREALGDAERWREVIDRWIAQNRSSARQGGATYEVDAEADFVVGKIFAILDGLARRRSLTDAGRAARALVLEHFTDARGRSGMGVMTQVVYEEQLPRMRRLLAAFDADEALARQVRVHDWVDDLREIEPRYAASLQATERVTWGEVIARRNTAYDSLFAVVGLAFARHRRDPATLSWLLAPLDDQVARAADLARRRRNGLSLGVSEDELSPEELAELDGTVDDLDGDGVPDAAAGEAPPAGDLGAAPVDVAPVADAEPDAEPRRPDLRPLPGADG